MRILSYLNVSNPSNLEADSGFIFQRTLLRELAKLGHESVIVGPAGMGGLPYSVDVVEVAFPESKYGVRFGFPWLELERKLRHVIRDVDVVLINQSEVTVPLSALVSELRGCRLPCVTYLHYIAVSGVEDDQPRFDPSQNDFGLGESIWRREVEGALHSDAVVVGSSFGRDLVLSASEYGDELASRVVVIPPPCRDDICNGKDKRNRAPVLLYNHRLYDHYGGRSIFDALCRVRNRRDFKVVVTDPTEGRSATRRRLDSSAEDLRADLESLPFVEVQHFPTQESYEWALRHADVGIAPFRLGPLWSMAAMDVMAAGGPVLAPRLGCFPELIGDQELLYDDYEEFESALERLLSSKRLLIRKGLAARQRCQKFSSRLIALRFEDLFRWVTGAGVGT